MKLSLQHRPHDFILAIILSSLLIGSARHPLLARLLVFSLQWIVPYVFILRSHMRIGRLEVVALSVLVSFFVWWALSPSLHLSPTPIRVAFGTTTPSVPERILYVLYSLFYLILICRVDSSSRKTTAEHQPDEGNRPAPLILRMLVVRLKLAVAAIASILCSVDLLGTIETRQWILQGAAPDLGKIVVLAFPLIIHLFIIVWYHGGFADDDREGDDQTLSAITIEALLVVVYLCATAVYLMNRFSELLPRA